MQLGSSKAQLQWQLSMYTKPCRTSKHYFTSNLFIWYYFNMNARINQTKPELYTQDSTSLSPVPKICSERGGVRVGTSPHQCARTAFGLGLSVSAVKSWFTWLAVNPWRCTWLPDIPLSPPDLTHGHIPTGSFVFLPALQSLPGGRKE